MGVTSVQANVVKNVMLDSKVKITIEIHFNSQVKSVVAKAGKNEVRNYEGNVEK